jgi:hypothetical protein
MIPGRALPETTLLPGRRTPPETLCCNRAITPSNDTSPAAHRHADPIEGDTPVDHNETSGRHRRRRGNSVTRAVLAEARRAGLVQRHLTKLHHLTARSSTASPGPETPGTTEPRPPALGRSPAAGPDTRWQPADPPASSNSEAAA